MLTVKTCNSIPCFNSKWYLAHIAVLVGLLIRACSSHRVNLGSKSVYDYIVVGGGTAGSVVAARLSEVPANEVLLLESGPEDTVNNAIEIPLAMGSLLNVTSGVTRLFKPEPQTNACKTLNNNNPIDFGMNPIINKDFMNKTWKFWVQFRKQPFWYQGNVLGGTSSINGMLYLRGTLHDFNKWKSDGLEGWGYEDVLNYFKKSENNANELYRQSGYHGTDGHWTITDNVVTDRLAETFIKAGRELGYPQRDLNGANAEGFMHSQQNLLKGKRQSTYRAFVDPIKGRRNLHIKTNCLVTKIIINDKIATGVYALDKQEGRTYMVIAKKEVIISAGTLLSPQLLMLSGIGPKSHLEDMGITFIQDLPVGNSLRDHVMTDLSFTFNDTVSLSFLDYFSPQELLQYLFYGKGAWSSNFHQGSALVRPGPTGGKTVLLNCDFDTDMCGFQQSNTDNFNWTRHSGSTSSDFTGPKNDHTKGDASGYYIYIEASGKDANTSAIIKSGSFQSPSGNQVCVCFYYHMYGKHVRALMVHEVNAFSVASEIWNKTKDALPYNGVGYGTDNWIKAEVTASGSARYIQFTGIRGGQSRANPYGDIAVDDVMVIDGSCRYQSGQEQEGQTQPPSTGPVTLMNCDFDKGVEDCKWTQLNGVEDNFDWSNKSGSTPSDNTGPSNDHTKGDGSGFYVFIEASGNDPNTTATLQTPIVPYHSFGKCLTFYYHMYGRHIGSFRVELLRDGGAVKIWELKNTDLEVSGNMVYGRDQWIRARMQIPAYEASFKFTAVRGGESVGQPFGDIALDDVSIVTGSCENQIQGQESNPSTAATPIVQCDFEEGSIENCGFTQDSVYFTDQFDWYLNSGETATSNTGPRTDHTFKNSSGHYIYIEASGINPGANAAIINSNPIQTNEPICVNFCYHMYGRHIGDLNVYEIHMDGQMKKIWHMTATMVIEKGYFKDDKKYDWMRARTTASEKTKYIKFVATKGGSSPGQPYGDIALDDILVTSKACGSGGQALDIISTPTNMVFFNCNFDKDECGFSQNKFSDDFDWTRFNGATQTSFTGPDNDHTQGSGYGHYMYVESTQQLAFNKAVLTMPKFSHYQYQAVCLTFYYHMYGQDIGSLSVFELSKSTGQVNLLWVKSGTGSGTFGVNGWLMAQVLGSSDTEAFIFQATVHGGPEGDIAMDDVIVVNGSCRQLASANDNIGYIPILPPESQPPLLHIEMLNSLFGNDPQSKLYATNINYRHEFYEALHAHEEGRHGMVLMLSLLHPRSEGTVRLRSNSIADDPKIVYNYLTDDNDIKDLIKGIRFIQNLTKTEAFKAIGTYYSTPHHPGCKALLNMNSDEYWECYIRHNTWTAYHYVSTCKMGVGSDAVVDNKLRVIGIRNLRVVDASVIPKTIGANTMATTVMIAEKAADMIKADSDSVSVTNTKRKVQVNNNIYNSKTKVKVEEHKEDTGRSVKEQDDSIYVSFLKKLQSLNIYN